MRNWAFYLPFCYTLFIRFSKVSQFISWVAIYIIPTLLVFLSFYEKGMFSFLLCYFLSVMLVYNYYEIGYIQNDTETIKKENNPTLRLTMIQLQYYKSHFILIYSSRIFGAYCCLYYYTYYRILFLILYVRLFYYYFYIKCTIMYAIDLLCFFIFYWLLYVIGQLYYISLFLYLLCVICCFYFLC